jgi:hypothetical protein
MNVLWKPFPSSRHDGTPGIMPGGIDENGKELQQILAMPKKKPIGYGIAITMFWHSVCDFLDEGNVDDAPAPSSFVQWVSDQGYHIELTGDEYEILDSTLN